MVETALYNRLEEYNQTIANNYKSNWGSLLNFLDGEDTENLTKKALEEQQEKHLRAKIVASMRPKDQDRSKPSRTVRDSKSVNVRGPNKAGNITQVYQNRVARIFDSKARLEQNY